jgi:2-(1,2-epoxy-1,2-dihydrophenyl)acetyl-CoA isomerase
MEPTVRIEHREGWRKLVLNRPDKLNPMNEAMLDELDSALGEADADPSCRAILVTGEGRGFCSGQELSRAVIPGPEGPPDLGALATRYHHRVVRHVRRLPKPVVCAVNGVAAGAGASLALACDIVLAARSASFVQAFARIGLVPDSGGTFFLPRLVGEARARALAMLAEPVPAEQAEAWGMIWKAVDDSRLSEEAEAIAARLAASATMALGLIKQAFCNDLDAQLDLEAALQSKAGQTADFAEGVQAFLEKRPARFTGR